jgi:cytosine/adenosine deaminase-related metal-dependent hydrolase
MRKISAQYLLTSSGKPLKRGVITAGDDGTIVSVEDTGGSLKESARTEFYNGIIIPGLVNCHNHLELSHLGGQIPAGGGLQQFITAVRGQRAAEPRDIAAAAEKAEKMMMSEGTVACGDISNGIASFEIKERSSIEWITFIEVFGSDPLIAAARISEALAVSSAAESSGLKHHITPHSLYSSSEELFSHILSHIAPESILSLHFLESDEERKMTDDHASRALALAARCRRLILVHNTVITRTEAELMAAAGNTWFCLCPSSNLQITNTPPPAHLLREVTGRIVIGTDSLASNNSLSILTEMRLLHDAAPELPLGEIIRWGTLNGAMALGLEETLGSLEPGKRPGLLLLEPVDLHRLRLLPETRVRRLL